MSACALHWVGMRMDESTREKELKEKEKELCFREVHSKIFHR